MTDHLPTAEDAATVAAAVRLPTYAVARHGVDPPPGSLDTVASADLDAEAAALADGVAVMVAAWARRSARDAGCRCSTWIDSRTVRTGPHELVVECWGHDRGCPAGPDEDGAARYAVVRL